MQSKSSQKIEAVAYCRVSTDDQVKGASLDAQAEDCRARIAAEEWQLVGEPFVDDGVSSSIPPAARPAFARLLNDSPGIIVVYALDRLVRSEYDWFTFRHDHPNVRVVTIADGIDTERQEHFMDGVRVLWAAEEKRRIRERTMRGRRQRVNAGRWVGGPAPFGRKSIAAPEGEGKVLALDEDETATIHRAVQLVRRRMTTAQVAETLNAEGLLPRRFNCRDGERDRVWTASGVRHVLSDESLSGVYRWGPEKTEVPVPVVLDTKTFRAVQRALGDTARQPYNTARDYPLSGRLRDEDGRRYVGWSHRQTFSYRVRGVSLKDAPTIPAEGIESRVWKAVCDFLLDREKLLALMTTPDDEDGQTLTGAQVEQLRAKIANLEKAKTDAQKRGLVLGWSDDEIRSVTDSLANDIETTTAHLDKLNSWREQSEKAEARRQAVLSLADLDEYLLDADASIQKQAYQALDLKARIAPLTAAEIHEAATGEVSTVEGPLLLPLRDEGQIFVDDGIAIAITGALSVETASRLAPTFHAETVFGGS